MIALRLEFISRHTKPTNQYSIVAIIFASKLVVTMVSPAPSNMATGFDSDSDVIISRAVLADQSAVGYQR